MSHATKNDPSSFVSAIVSEYLNRQPEFQDTAKLFNDHLGIGTFWKPECCVRLEDLVKGLSSTRKTYCGERQNGTDGCKNRSQNENRRSHLMPQNISILKSSVSLITSNSADTSQKSTNPECEEVLEVIQESCSSESEEEQVLPEVQKLILKNAHHNRSANAKNIRGSTSSSLPTHNPSMSIGKRSLYQELIKNDLKNQIVIKSSASELGAVMPETQSVTSSTSSLSASISDHECENRSHRKTSILPKSSTFKTNASLVNWDARDASQNSSVYECKQLLEVIHERSSSDENERGITVPSQRVKIPSYSNVSRKIDKADDVMSEYDSEAEAENLETPSKVSEPPKKKSKLSTAELPIHDDNEDSLSEMVPIQSAFQDLFEKMDSKEQISDADKAVKFILERNIFISKLNAKYRIECSKIVKIRMQKKIGKYGRFDKFDEEIIVKNWYKLITKAGIVSPETFFHEVAERATRTKFHVQKRLVIGCYLCRGLKDLRFAANVWSRFHQICTTQQYNKYTAQEDNIILREVQRNGDCNETFKSLAKTLGRYRHQDIKSRYLLLKMKATQVKGRWKADEDYLLLQYALKNNFLIRDNSSGIKGAKMRLSEWQELALVLKRSQHDCYYHFNRTLLPILKAYHIGNLYYDCSYELMKAIADKRCRTRKDVVMSELLPNFPSETTRSLALVVASNRQQTLKRFPHLRELPLHEVFSFALPHYKDRKFTKYKCAHRDRIVEIYEKLKINHV